MMKGEEKECRIRVQETRENVGDPDSGLEVAMTGRWAWERKRTGWGSSHSHSPPTAVGFTPPRHLHVENAAFVTHKRHVPHVNSVFGDGGRG